MDDALRRASIRRCSAICRSSSRSCATTTPPCSSSGRGRRAGPTRIVLICGKALVEASRGRFRDALRSAVAAAESCGTIGRRQPLRVSLPCLMRAEVGLPPARRLDVAPDAPVGARLRARCCCANRAPRRRPSSGRCAPAGVSLAHDRPEVRTAARSTPSSSWRRTTPQARPPRWKPASEARSRRHAEPSATLYSSYIRGSALLQAGDHAAAAAEFQRILSRPSLAGRGVVAPLAPLQLARAQSALGDDAAALASYEASSTCGRMPTPKFRRLAQRKPSTRACSQTTVRPRSRSSVPASGPARAGTPR